MKKIPTLFLRDPDNLKKILKEPNPLCQWVFDGPNIATRKYDGTCCMIKDGEFYKRHTVEYRDKKVFPEGFILADFDPNTDKCFGWVPVTGKDRWHLEAFTGRENDGTYELCGPKIQGNPEDLTGHVLISHEYAEEILDLPRTYDAIKTYLYNHDIEGIVFHHVDGRMAKIKQRDFGFKR